MTSIKNNVRCRRRHKRGEESRTVELEKEHLQPSCSQTHSEVEPIDKVENLTRIRASSSRMESVQVSAEPMLEKHRLRMGKTRRRQDNSLESLFFRTPSILLFSVCAVLLVQPVSAITEVRCGPIDIRNSPMGFRVLTSHSGDPNAVDANATALKNNGEVDCTIIEGSFTISFMYLKKHERLHRGEYNNGDFPRFPKLREITGSLLLFETTGLTSLRHVMPNLRVIGGTVLIQHYAIVIYRNHDLENLGLDNLRVIRNGGVRIMENQVLCHTRSIDWKRMIMSSVNDVYVDNAAEGSVTETGKMCQSGHCVEDPDETKCHYHELGDNRLQSCWTNTTCQRACAHEKSGDKMGPGCDPNGQRCHEQCLGGCDRVDDPLACHACRNMHYKGKCIEKCDSHLFVLMSRRCVSKQQCLSLNPLIYNETVFIKATTTEKMNLCSHRCPEEYEVDPLDKKKCRKCVGECSVICPGNFTIDTYAKAVALRQCNIIGGSLTIEIRGAFDSGMAAKLNEFFSKITVIKGYLQVLRSPPLLSLHMFRNLKRIEGEYLVDTYALSILDNANLRKLFAPETSFTIGTGRVQIQNNRMLCFQHIKTLMGSLGKSKEMEENDQSSKSNGDKAICEDTRIDARVSSISHDHFVIEWTPFNTTNMDHRKFLGYEIFYKSVPYPDENMSIDDDRSACVDSWNSVFQQYKPLTPDENGHIPKTLSLMLYTDQRIHPHTTYAFYVATQMVHHEGAKNGVSKIGFVTTHPYRPDPPIVTVQKVDVDSIELSWLPPARPNGILTSYEITWREIDVDTSEHAETFCQDHSTRALGVVYGQHDLFDDEDDSTTAAPQTTVAPSMLSLIKSGKDTCSSTPGCCACGVRQMDVEKTDENARCEDPVRCAMAKRLVPEWENLDEDEDEDIETPSQKRRRNTEAFERKRRQLYQQVNAIRNSEDYEQFTAMIIDSIRRRRAIENANRVSEMLEKKENEMTTEKPTKDASETGEKTIIVTTTAAVPPATTARSSVKFQNEKYVVAEKVTDNVTADVTTFIITRLKHYTTYSITVMACQTNPKSCSHGFQASKKKRTRPKANIDRVVNETIKAEFLNDTNTIQVTWKSPNETNGGIIGYIVQMVGLDGRTPTQSCVAAKKGWSPELNGTYFKGIADGDYRVSITAYSLYRNGEPSISYQTITVFTPGFFTLEVIIVCIAAFLLLVALGALLVYFYVRRFYGRKVKAMADFMQNNPEYCNEQVYIKDDWELPENCVERCRQLGEGSFGQVYLGAGDNVTTKMGDVFGPCAIKINLEDLTAAESLNYLMEANIMKNFDTSFIVKLYGVISTQTPAWVVMELMEKGNLRDYLRSKRDDDIFNELDCEYYGVIARETYHEWAAQISDGMAYLESLKFCHRDLAARNCMIDAQDRVKIGDFGMARDLFYHEYYKPSGKRMMPVRWMSPESLKDGKFDSKSDMWSFGIVLYEMMTLGAQPYIGLSNDEVLNYIGMSRKVIKKPECCSEYWYKIMLMCWRFNPRDRPSFLQLVHLFSPGASQEFRDSSFVLNDNQIEECEMLDMGGTEDCEMLPSDYGQGESIPMREIRPSLNGAISPSPNSVHDLDSAAQPLLSGAKESGRQRSVDDEYALMNHSRGPSDAEVRNYIPNTANVVDGDYVERDVPMDVPTRRNTGASSSSYGNGPYCLTNRGGSTASNSAGFMESVRLTDGIGSGHLDEGDYVEKDLSSMDTRRSTGASTASYGYQPTWTANKGATFYADKDRPKTGGGDRLTQLPGTGNLHNRGGDYIETEAKNGSPSRNGNGPYPPRGSFNGRTKFGEDDKLLEDHETPQG